MIGHIQLELNPSVANPPSRPLCDCHMTRPILGRFIVMFEVCPLIWKLEVVSDPPKRMKPIREGNGKGPHLLHRPIANPQHRQNKIKLLDGHLLPAALIIHDSTNNHRNREQKLCDIIQRRVSIE